MSQRRICPACAEWFSRDEDRPREDGTHSTRWWLFVCSRECWTDHESMTMVVAALTGSIVSVAQLADDPWVQEALRYALRRRRELAKTELDNQPPQQQLALKMTMRAKTDLELRRAVFYDNGGCTTADREAERERIDQPLVPPGAAHDQHSQGKSEGPHN